MMNEMTILYKNIFFHHEISDLLVEILFIRLFYNQFDNLTYLLLSPLTGVHNFHYKW